MDLFERILLNDYVVPLVLASDSRAFLIQLLKRIPCSFLLSFRKTKIVILIVIFFENKCLSSLFYRRHIYCAVLLLLAFWKELIINFKQKLL